MAIAVMPSKTLTLLLFCSNFVDHGKQTLRQKRIKTKIKIFRDTESSTFATDFDLTET
ncbi:hypothetical protein F2P79_002417, partial [Pimephales promelas]